MSTNQTLQSVINSLPPKLRSDIIGETDVKTLNKLKLKHKTNSDIVAVIDARIENLNYLL